MCNIRRFYLNSTGSCFIAESRGSIGVCACLKEIASVSLRRNLSCSLFNDKSCSIRCARKCEPVQRSKCEFFQPDGVSVFIPAGILCVLKYNSISCGKIGTEVFPIDFTAFCSLGHSVNSNSEFIIILF